jgi:hypothetical protein
MGRFSEIFGKKKRKSPEKSELTNQETTDSQIKSGIEPEGLKKSPEKSELTNQEKTESPSKPKIEFDTLNPLSQPMPWAKNLAGFGLVSVNANTSTGFKITADGVLYIDGMLCGDRYCAEHPKSYSDLTAVSRGRMMLLKSNDLSLLSAIFLGAALSEKVVVTAKKSQAEKSIAGALQTLAGWFAHSVRHNGNGAKIMKYDELELTAEGKGIFEGYVKVSKTWPKSDVMSLVDKLSQEIID